LPKAQKPKELPNTSFSTQAAFLVIAGLSALLVGSGAVWRKLKR
jgi:LPXTG-motif cell wall-anchored protein